MAVGEENGTDVKIYYEDHGSGQPVVLIHGYPLNSDSWERQESAGYRVIRYDRRGFGKSGRPTTGYDYETFTDDLKALLEKIDLGIVLVGFSMGTGEVTHYLGKYGSARVRKAVLFGAIPPFVLKTDDNPEGVDGQVFEDIKAAIVKDRYAYFKDFFDNFYNVDKLGPERISPQAWQAGFNVAAGASPHATYACVETWLTDFRADLPNIDVPVLVVHGTEDRILPFESTAKRLPDPRREPEASRGRGRPTQHRLDAPRRSQQGAPRLPRRRFRPRPRSTATSPPPPEAPFSSHYPAKEAGPAATTSSAAGPATFMASTQAGLLDEVRAVPSRLRR